MTGPFRLYPNDIAAKVTQFLLDHDSQRPIPVLAGVPAFVFSLPKLAGLAIANNYMSIANPSGSDKAVILGAFFFSSTKTTGLAPDATPMRGFRASAISGGTLHNVAEIGKFLTTQIDPIAEIRSANPSATLGPAIFNSPQPVDQRSSSVHEIDIPAGARPFILLPGEGVVVRAESQGTDVSWNMSIAWAERK